MIVEVGLFRINPSRVDEFAPVAQDIRDTFARGISGLRFFELSATIEDAGRWAVLAGWDAVSYHENFVGSPEGARQRDLLGRFMVGDPEVFHISATDRGAWAP